MIDFADIQDLIDSTQADSTFVHEVIKDYWICAVSREVSLLARKEVLLGKAKFGITGDGKEVPQVALARALRPGDWRAGYYRDQTLMFALNACSIEDYFAQLYADCEHDPFSGGRQMVNHFATRMVDQDGAWVNQLTQFNVSADVSCTAGQMARSLGLAYASALYRDHPEIDQAGFFSLDGQEICICTIGDSSTSEGVFWETVNAAAVLKVPLAIFIWDDGYGISVPTELQTAKGDISKLLEGFVVDDTQKGIHLYTIKGWDYPTLVDTIDRGIALTRKTHIPAVFHITELTQPQGHSTSGSHERYKSAERLQWERDHDGLQLMGEWMIQNGLISEDALHHLRNKAKDHVRKKRHLALTRFTQPIKNLVGELEMYFQQVMQVSQDERFISLLNSIRSNPDPMLSDVVRTATRLNIALLTHRDHPLKSQLARWIKSLEETAAHRYNTWLYNEAATSALKVRHIPAKFSAESEYTNGYQVLNAFFDQALANHPQFIAFGEDVGKIGGVNQSFAGLQEKYGKHRVFDTGIREWTIIGQAVGLAMRGWRPLAEIQYVDYLAYALPELTDDVACLTYRTKGLQIAPIIVRTRGHRLEGIWHAGSPMGMILNSVRGMHMLVPRNATQAAGFYNTLLQSNDPAIVIECLNGYRLKERLPDNVGSYTVPLGVVERLVEGSDVTLVTYGSCIRIALEGIKLLEPLGITVELIDVQSLLPFDTAHFIASSIAKTNRLVVMDEDMPGGATGYMLREIVEIQDGFQYLDAKPVTICAKPHRPPYASDGDYFSKPNAEDVFVTIYSLMSESAPHRFPPMI